MAEGMSADDRRIMNEIKRLERQITSQGCDPTQNFDDLRTLYRGIRNELQELQIDADQFFTEELREAEKFTSVDNHQQILDEYRQVCTQAREKMGGTYAPKRGAVSANIGVNEEDVEVLQDLLAQVKAEAAGGDNQEADAIAFRRIINNFSRRRAIARNSVFDYDQDARMAQMYLAWKDQFPQARLPAGVDKATLEGMANDLPDSGEKIAWQLMNVDILGSLCLAGCAADLTSDEFLLAIFDVFEASASGYGQTKIEAGVALTIGPAARPITERMASSEGIHQFPGNIKWSRISQVCGGYLDTESLPAIRNKVPQGILRSVARFNRGANEIYREYGKRRRVLQEGRIFLQVILGRTITGNSMLATGDVFECHFHRAGGDGH